MKKLTLIVLAALMVVGITSPARSTEPASTKDTQASVRDELFEDTVAKDGVRTRSGRGDVAAAVRELKKDGRVAVMASLDVPFAAEATLPEADVLAQRAEIAAAQAAVAAVVRLNGGTVRRTPETVPAISFDASAATLDAVARMEHVTRLRRVEQLRKARVASVPAVGAIRTHRSSLNGQGRTVAVLDTGVDTAHAEFRGRIALQACYVSSGCPGGGTTATGPGSGSPCTGDMNDCAHGTHVAGIAAGTGGVARGARLATVRVFDDGGDSATDDDILMAIDHVYVRRATMRLAAINLSLGGDDPHLGLCDEDFEDMARAFANVKAAGIAPVVAAGNDGWRTAVSFPACVSSAIAVTNLARRSDGTYEFAGDTNTSPKTLIGAPGTWILSTVPGGGTARMSGTSMAAPHVAGAFAFVRQHTDTISVDQALDYLRRGARLTDQRDGGSQTLNMLMTDPAMVHMQAWRNNNFASARLLNQTSGQATGSTGAHADGRGYAVNFGKQVGEPNHGGNAGGRSVWFRWDIPSATFDGWATIATHGSNFDTLLGVYRGTAVGALTQIAGNDDADGQNTSSVTFDVSGGTTVYIAVDGYRTSVTGRAAGGSYVINYGFSQRYPSFGQTDTQRPSFVYGIQPDGGLYCYRHNGYTTGAGVGTPGAWQYGTQVGSGWSGFKQVFSGSAAIYGIAQDGTLYWYRHDGANDCSSNWKGATAVGSGWQNFKHVFAMTSGDGRLAGVIYAITQDGTLSWYRHVGYAGGERMWEGPRVVAGGWGDFKDVFSGGDGVIYALKQDGTLVWYEHKGFETGETSVWGPDGRKIPALTGPKTVATGWQLNRIVLAGRNDGIIYTVDANEDLRWFRHDGFRTGDRVWSGGHTVGHGWGGYRNVFLGTTAPATPVR